MFSVVTEVNTFHKASFHHNAAFSRSLSIIFSVCSFHHTICRLTVLVLGILAQRPANLRVNPTWRKHGPVRSVQNCIVQACQICASKLRIILCDYRLTCKKKIRVQSMGLNIGTLRLAPSQVIVYVFIICLGCHLQLPHVLWHDFKAKEFMIRFNYIPITAHKWKGNSLV